MRNWIMQVHQKIARVVLGRRLVEKTARLQQEARERFDRLRKLEEEINESTQEIRRESGIFMVPNGNH